MKTQLPATLHEMLNSRAWDYFISDRLGNDLFINDPDRAARIHDAAESGADGSTHAEHIQDQRDFAKQLRDCAFREEEEGCEGSADAWLDSINAQLDKIEAWHEKNGSLHEEVG